MPHRAIAGLWMFTLLISVAVPVRLSAQDVQSEGCFRGVYDLIAQEERYYRSVLYGQKPSEDLSLGSVRYDKEGNTWMKTDDNQWRSLSEGFTGTSWSDMLMDEQADVPARRGIFEIKTTPTSDLLPPLIQSTRALQCRLRAICELGRMSQDAHIDPAKELLVRVDGCVPQLFLPLQGCTETQIVNMGAGTCDEVADAVIDREGRLLHLAIAYDAAYRSLLQFAGNLEGFLLDFRFPLLTPIWQAIRALGYLDRLPCFSAQCDE